MKHPLPIILILLAGAASVHALPPTSRQAVGRIESVDSVAQQFVFVGEGSAGNLALVWNRRTAFYHGGGKSSAAMLKRGQSVRVSYRTPFFGPRYASRIIFLTDAAFKVPSVRRSSAR